MRVNYEKKVYDVNTILKKVSQLDNTKAKINIEPNTKIKAGIDLGTSCVVLIVVDYKNNPIIVASEEANVVKDGLVVNFMETVSVVKRLKNQAEEQLQRPLTFAASAIPPGIAGNNKKIFENVLQGADIEVTEIFEEPTAAAAVLQVDRGAIVDIGGGTTGISIFKNGKVNYSADEATGGHHMTLVLAGYHGISSEEGEDLKRNPTNYDCNFSIMKPVAEKMAYITKEFLHDYGEEVKCIYLVGGVMMYPQFGKIFRDITQLEVRQPSYSKYVTPLGIAYKSIAF